MSPKLFATPLSKSPLDLGSVQYAGHDESQFLGPDFKKTDSFYFLFLGLLTLRTQSPCCKEAQAVLWRGPCETNSQHQLRVAQLRSGSFGPS